MGKASRDRQVNMFRRKRRRAPFHPMKRGFFTPSRRKFRHKIQKRKW